MRKILVIISVVCGIFLMFWIAVNFPSMLPTGSDFSAIYNTDLALMNGIPIYDLTAVRVYVQPLSGLPDDYFFLARFPYPAWYALSTFYLGLLPASSAAVLWFELNLVMLFLSVWFLTDGWPGRIRLFMFPAALLFLPVLGALVVGQYDLPVLLGTALLLYGLKREKIAAVVGGAVLLTYKPHVGALIFLFLMIWLFVRAGDFGKRTIKYITASLGGLTLLGFIADPNWIFGYAKMLLSYQGEGNVTSCSECISLPMLISRGLFDGSLRTAVFVGSALFILLAVVFYSSRSILLKSPTVFIVTALFMTLLVSPYFYNYDFILLVIPFAVIFDQTRRWAVKVVLGMCYLAPYFAIGLYARDGNIILIVVTLVLILLFSLKVKSIDVPVTPA